MHGKRVLVVTNTTVAPLYLDKVTDALTRDNPKISVETVILPDGEQYKDMVCVFDSEKLCVCRRLVCYRIDIIIHFSMVGHSNESL